MFYNKDMLTKAGLPRRPGHVGRRRCRGAARSRQPARYGFGMQGKELETDVYWYYALWSYGGDLIGKRRQGGLRRPCRA